MGLNWLSVYLSNGTQFASVNGTQDLQSPQGMEFPNFSLTTIKFLCVSKTVKGGMLPQKIFKIRMLRLAESEFHTTKFTDFSCFFRFPDFFSFYSNFPDISWFSRSLDTLGTISDHLGICFGLQQGYLLGSLHFLIHIN